MLLSQPKSLFLSYWGLCHQSDIGLLCLDPASAHPVLQRQGAGVAAAQWVPPCPLMLLLMFMHFCAVLWEQSSVGEPGREVKEGRLQCLGWEKSGKRPVRELGGNLAVPVRTGTVDQYVVCTLPCSSLAFENLYVLKLNSSCDKGAFIAARISSRILVQAKNEFTRRNPFYSDDSSAGKVASQ